MLRTHSFALFLIVCLSICLPCRAAVKLPALISNHMAIQRDQAVPIWGWADPDEAVTVSINDQQKHVTANPDGKWMVKLDPQPAGGPFEMTVSASNNIVIKDVLVGEVWLCAGQSNMGMPVERSMNAEKEVAAAKFPQMRLFRLERTISDEPQQDCKGEWQVCSPETVGKFSAAGYFFGRQIHQDLKVPVGLICSAWGGTSGESWISKEGMAAHPELAKAADERWAKELQTYEVRHQKQVEELEKWKPLYEAAKAKGEKPPHKPWGPKDPKEDPSAPHRLFNGMINPLVPYGIRGIIWYHGASNINSAYAYRTLFADLIRDYRQRWGEGDIPFIFGQIGGWHTVPKQPVESAYAELREAQFLTLKNVPNTAMAMSLDICEGVTHFENKQEFGRRLALPALALVYGHKDLEYSGPLYDSMEIDGNKIRIRFTHAAGLKTSDAQSVKSLAIAGDDRKFVWAQSKIEGQTLIVWSDDVPHPAAVRYAWAEWPPVNLVNSAGLPASPFRTDDWTMITKPKR